MARLELVVSPEQQKRVDQVEVVAGALGRDQVRDSTCDRGGQKGGAAVGERALAITVE